MQFLKTLFWVVIAIVAVVFAMNNWFPVTVRLWGVLVVDFKLPVLLLLAFLAGLVPTLILHRATRWRMRRRLDAAERALVSTPAVAGGEIAAIDPLAPPSALGSMAPPPTAL